MTPAEILAEQIHIANVAAHITEPKLIQVEMQYCPECGTRTNHRFLAPHTPVCSVCLALGNNCNQRFAKEQS